MLWRAVQGGWVVILDRGDDLHECLKQAAGEAGIRSGAISGLGAVDGVQLAYWNLGTREYERRDFDGDYEIGALVGNFAILDGNPFAHVHAVLGGRDFAAVTGHVMRARCSATVEIFVHDYASPVERRFVAEIGLNLCRL